MPSALRTQEQRRTVSESAILDAAARLFAEQGPDGASMREVARAAGVTHPLIARYFESKQGLTDRVGERLTERIAAEVEAVGSSDRDGFAGLLRSLRADRTTTKLLIRAALGDLQPDGFPACLRGDWSKARICNYAVASLLLGWLALDGFLTPAMQLGNVGVGRRDLAMAGAAAHLATLAAADQPRLALRRSSPDGSERRVAEPGKRPADVALLASAIELFARHGPASVSIRDVARHAGVNHGLVHRHFGSKEDLITAAIAAGVSPLLPGTLAPGGFDLDEVVDVAHRDPTSVRLLARTLVDDIPIGSVRRSYPVMRTVLAVAREAPAASRPSCLDDPRLAAAAAAAMVSGSALWGSFLRELTGIRGDVVPAMANLSRQLLGLRPVVGPGS